MSQRCSTLKVWQEAHKLTLDIYKITSAFPSEEKFGLVSQLRRSSSSIPANLAEGSERKHPKEFIQFSHIAKGSLGEVRYFLLLSYDLGYINNDTYVSLESKCDTLVAMLNGFIESLEKKL